MSYFNCRLLMGGAYETAVRELERVAAGDAAALAFIRERCRSWLESEAFWKWHSGDLGRYRQTRWRKLVDRLPDHASPDAAQSIADVFIAAACMPEFQAKYGCGQASTVAHADVSPNLVPLGDYDGGLLGILVTASGSFANIFFAGFARPQKYGVGAAMVIFDHAELPLLRVFIAQATDDQCRTALVPEACLDARARLETLVARCLSLENGLLAVEDTSG
jgi:hypothetical protein